MSIPRDLGAALDNRHFNLILFPTEQCNFRCTYCYEDFLIGKMRPEVVTGVKNLIQARMPELRSFELSWFGGEPLLAKDLMLDIGGFTAGLARQSGVHYSANATTNGFFLDAEAAERFYEVGVSMYQISLDGEGAEHDRTRKRVGGQGTFDRIWKNLLDLHRSSLPVQVILRIHFTPANAPTLRPLIDRINAELGDDDRFSVYFKSVSHLGSPNDATFQTFSYSEAREVKQDLERLVANHRQVAIHVLDKKYICYASRPNSLAIRADGSINKCTVALQDERNAVGRLNPDGTMAFEQDRLKYWFRGLESLDEYQLACPMKAP